MKYEIICRTFETRARVRQCQAWMRSLKMKDREKHNIWTRTEKEMANICRHINNYFWKKPNGNSSGRLQWLTRHRHSWYLWLFLSWHPYQVIPYLCIAMTVAERCFVRICQNDVCWMLENSKKMKRKWACVVQHTFPGTIQFFKRSARYFYSLDDILAQFSCCTCWRPQLERWIEHAKWRPTNAQKGCKLSTKVQRDVL
jgi:hypothetical protein